MARIWFVFVIVVLQMLQSSVSLHSKENESLGFIRCKKNELNALLKFKQSFTKDPLNRLLSWVGEDCCEWHRVTCDNGTHNVVKLNLRTQHYRPPYYDCFPHDEVSMVSSGVSSALRGLSFLTHLDLNGNKFSGSRIPKFIGSLRHLRYLNLSSAGFSDTIPPQFGNLTNLLHLDLNNHEECGDHSILYGEDLRWVSGLLKLQSFDMSGYNMSRAHDTLKVLNTLPSLLAVGLSYCQLDNSHLSEALIGNTSNSFFLNLQHLDLGWNNFEGPFPPIFKNMVSLRFLCLSDNTLNGSVPLWLRTMRHLKVLDLSFNAFNYVEGKIMGIMGNPCHFKHLDLSYNYINQGDILEPSMNLSGCSAFELQYLNLRSNALKGSLPSSLAQLINLNYIDLSINKMNGTLPFLLGQLANLNYLDFSVNEFKGQIPSSFVNLSALKYLDLSSNQLGGLIPDFIKRLSEIHYIDISSNSLYGTVLGIGNLSKLSDFAMSNNHFNLNFDSSFNWRPPF